MLANKQAVEIALKAYYDVFQKQDWAAFQNLLTEDFSYYTDACVIQDKTDFVAFITKTDWKINSYNLSNLKIIASDKEDLAIAIYKIKFQGVSQNQELTLYATETTVFRKEESGYKIVHSHASNK